MKLTSMRKWFNAELRKFAPKITGSVLNVGAGDDIDNEGGHYRDYFTGATKYHTVDTNGKCDYKTIVSVSDPYDNVLSFWVLEHVFYFMNHIHEIGLHARKRLIIAVPTKYPYHPAPGDYWRFTHEAMEKLLEPFFAIEYMSKFDDGKDMAGIFAVARRK
jgi:hypothetical protein